MKFSDFPLEMICFIWLEPIWFQGNFLATNPIVKSNKYLENYFLIKHY